MTRSGVLGGSRNAIVRAASANLLGSAVTLVGGFVVVVIASRKLGAGGAGALFEAIAVFTILSLVCQVGSSTASVRLFAQLPMVSRRGGVRIAIIAMTGPLVIAMVAGMALVSFSDSIALRLNGSSEGGLATYLRLAGVALPAATIGSIALGCLRGMGSRYAYPAVDSTVKPMMRVVAFLIVGWAYETSAQAWALAWFGPAMVSSLLAIALFTRRVSRAPRSHATSGPGWRAFWRYSAPLAVSDLAQVGVQWIDVLMVGVIVGTVATGIYTGVARCITVGELVLVAVGLAVAPYLAALFGRRETHTATEAYAACTSVIVALGGPVFICYLAFPRTILTIFGSSFRQGADALMVLSVAMIASLIAGPILMALTMSGRSGRVLSITVLALLANVAGNVVLIPIFGLTGAAVSWAGATLVTNAAGWMWSRDLLDVRLVARKVSGAVCFATVCFAIPALGSRSIAGDSWKGVCMATAVGAVMYGIGVVSSRRYLLQLIDWNTVRDLRDAGAAERG